MPRSLFQALPSPQMVFKICLQKTPLELIDNKKAGTCPAFKIKPIKFTNARLD